MGNSIPTLQIMQQEPSMQILVVGQGGSGKTTLVDGIKYHPSISRFDREGPEFTITLGLNEQDIKVHGTSFTMLDVDSRSFMRPMWRAYYPTIAAIVFVLDCSPNQPDARLRLAKKEFDLYWNEEGLKDKPMLIFCNKQDQENAMSPAEAAKFLDLTNCDFEEESRKWTVVGCSGMNGRGLMEGMHWMKRVLESKASGNRFSYSGKTVLDAEREIETKIGKHDDERFDGDESSTASTGSLTVSGSCTHALVEEEDGDDMDEWAIIGKECE